MGEQKCTHELKTWPVYFRAVQTGAKAFEWRKDDRGYQIGDTLVLKEWDDGAKEYTGQEVRCEVTYIARGVFGIPEGYAVLSIRVYTEEPAAYIHWDVYERACEKVTQVEAMNLKASIEAYDAMDEQEQG
jgi:hypothetical protein